MKILEWTDVITTKGSTTKDMSIEGSTTCSLDLARSKQRTHHCTKLPFFLALNLPAIDVTSVVTYKKRTKSGLVRRVCRRHMYVFDTVQEVVVLAFLRPRDSPYLLPRMEHNAEKIGRESARSLLHQIVAAYQHALTRGKKETERVLRRFIENSEGRRTKFEN